MTLAGKGKKSALRDLARKGNKGSFISEGVTVFRLFVHCYKHVGTWMPSDPRAGHEVSVRCGAMTSICFLQNQIHYIQESETCYQ